MPTVAVAGATLNTGTSLYGTAIVGQAVVSGHHLSMPIDVTAATALGAALVTGVGVLACSLPQGVRALGVDRWCLARMETVERGEDDLYNLMDRTSPFNPLGAFGYAVLPVVAPFVAFIAIAVQVLVLRLLGDQARSAAISVLCAATAFSISIVRLRIHLRRLNAGKDQNLTRPKRRKAPPLE